MHYCGNEIESAAIYTQPDSCCGDDADQSSDCCHNEKLVKQYSGESSHKNTQRLIAAPAFICNFLAPDQSARLSIFETSHQTVIKHTQPPPLIHAALRIDTIEFRI